MVKEEIEITAYNQKDFELRERFFIISALHKNMEMIMRKIESGRIRDPTRERIKIQYCNALAYTASVYNSLLRDKELEELRRDVEELKKVWIVEQPK